MAVERRATARWTGTIASGSGRLEAGSGALASQPYSWQTRIGDAAGRTSPEELIASAHAACFTMALASQLTERGIAANDITVHARCVEGPVDDGFAITNLDLDVTVDAAGLTPDALQAIVDAAHADCPVSRALRGNVDIRIAARLA